MMIDKIKAVMSGAPVEGMPDAPSKISPDTNDPAPDPAQLALEVAVLKAALAELKDILFKNFPGLKI